MKPSKKPSAFCKGASWFSVVAFQFSEEDFQFTAKLPHKSIFKAACQSWPVRQYTQIKQCGKEIHEKLLVIIMIQIKRLHICRLLLLYLIQPLEAIGLTATSHPLVQCVQIYVETWRSILDSSFLLN